MSVVLVFDRPLILRFFKLLSLIWLVHLVLVLIYAEKGWKEAVKVEVARISRISPASYSMKTLCQRLPYKDQAVYERVIEGLRKAGIFPISSC